MPSTSRRRRRRRGMIPSTRSIWTPRVNIHTDLEDPAEVPPGDPADVRPVATSVVRRGWGSSVFGIVAEGHVRRRPSDIVRVGLAAAVVALAAFGATDLTRLEAAAFDVFASLPSGLEPVWEVLYLLTPIVAGVLLVTALVARRHGLLATQLVAAGVAWAVGALLSAVVDVPESLSDAARALNGRTPHFPVVLMAAGAAGLWASRPYLTRPARRLIETAFWLQRAGGRRAARGTSGCGDRQPRARLGRGRRRPPVLRLPGGDAVHQTGGRLAARPRRRPDRPAPRPRTALGWHQLHGGAERRAGDRRRGPRRDRRPPVRPGLAIRLVQGLRTDADVDPRAPGRAPGLRAAARRPDPCPGARAGRRRPGGLA